MGACPDCHNVREAPAEPGTARSSAARKYDQNQLGCRSRSSNDTQATGRAIAAVHAVTSVVFPNPAGAETTVRGASAAWVNRPVEPGPGHLVAAQPWTQQLRRHQRLTHPRSPCQCAGATSSRCACTCIRSPGRPKMLSTSAGLFAGAAEPVRHLGVELGRLSDAEDEVLVAEHRAASAPTARRATRTRRGCAASASTATPGSRSSTPGRRPGRVSGSTVRPLTRRGLSRIRGSPTSGAPTRSSMRHPVRLRQRQQQLQARAPLPGLQPGQGALGDPGLLGGIGQRQPALLAHPTQSRTDQRRGS